MATVTIDRTTGISAAEETEQKFQYPGIPTTCDGAEAVVWVETRVCQGSGAYPITSSTTMGGGFNAAVMNGQPNLWGDDLVFVDNASTGATAVLRSMPFAAGDEILMTDHAYGGVARAAEFVAAERAAVVRLVRVPYPDYSPNALIDAVADAIGPETRLAVFDHITSESALIFPVAELVALCHSRGVPVLIDGAHVPGALALDVPSLGADWYTANLHKWAQAPRSAGFLWVHPDRQRDVRRRSERVERHLLAVADSVQVEANIWTGDSTLPFAHFRLRLG